MRDREPADDHVRATMWNAERFAQAAMCILTRATPNGREACSDGSIVVSVRPAWDETDGPAYQAEALELVTAVAVANALLGEWFDAAGLPRAWENPLVVRQPNVSSDVIAGLRRRGHLLDVAVSGVELVSLEEAALLLRVVGLSL